MPKSPLDLDTIVPETALIHDEKLRRVVKDIWQDCWSRSGFADVNDVPVTAQIRQPQVLHSRATALSCMSVAQIHSDLHGAIYDLDTLAAGALLADVSKLVEWEPGPDNSVRRSALGKALPHAVFATHLAIDAGAGWNVIHIIASHSPSSQKAPESIEARLVHWIDQADVSGIGFDIWTRKVIHQQ